MNGREQHSEVVQQQICDDALRQEYLLLNLISIT